MLSCLFDLRLGQSDNDVLLLIVGCISGNQREECLVWSSQESMRKMHPCSCPAVSIVTSELQQYFFPEQSHKKQISSIQNKHTETTTTATKTKTHRQYNYKQYLKKETYRQRLQYEHSTQIIYLGIAYHI